MKSTENTKGLLKAIDTDLPLTDYYTEGDDYDEFMESVEQGIFEEEIIYYSEALKYLAENDASLTESTAMFIEVGGTLEDLNSEILATLLYQRKQMEKLWEIEEEVLEAFELEL